MIPYKLPFRFKPEYLTLQNEQNSTQTHQLILPRLKLSLVIWQKKSCSIRDDLWKATTVLLNFGQKMTRILPMPLQLGLRPMAILVIGVASLDELCWIMFLQNRGMWKKERHLHLSSLYLLGELDLKQCYACKAPRAPTVDVMLLKEIVKISEDLDLIKNFLIAFGPLQI